MGDMIAHPLWHDLLRDCFSSTEYLSLATHGSGGPWVNPVYFAWDEKFSLYFISELNCLHMDNIAAHPEVACAIYSTGQSSFSDVCGAYARGMAKILMTPDEKERADEIYYGRRYPDDRDGKKKNADGYRIDPNWHFVKITLTGLWYFDTRHFGERRVKVPETVWAD